MIVVTGATGHFGRLVVQGLLEKVPANRIVAAVRSLEKAKDLAALGVEVREADYSRTETLANAFASAEKILLVSSSEVGSRLAQHKAVVDAAKRAGVQLLAYTSILRANTSTLKLAVEHKRTEEFIKASGMPFVFLRNGWYLENQTGTLAAAIEHGKIIGAAGDGRFAAASRADYAKAAVRVLTSDGDANRVYELGGDNPYTLAELAAEVSLHTGKHITYHNMTEPDYAAALVEFGLPASIADILGDADTGASKGELDNSTHDLRALIQQPTTTLSSAVRAALNT